MFCDRQWWPWSYLRSLMTELIRWVTHIWTTTIQKTMCNETCNKLLNWLVSPALHSNSLNSFSFDKYDLIQYQQQATIYKFWHQITVHLNMDHGMYPCAIGLQHEMLSIINNHDKQTYEEYFKGLIWALCHKYQRRPLFDVVNIMLKMFHVSI